MTSKSKGYFIILILFLVIYVTVGIYTELVFIGQKPLPDKLLSDFRLYQLAHQRVSAGISPYDGVFLYPPPSLLIVGLFSRISNIFLQASFYLTINILLISLLVYGVACLYGLGIEEIWYWFPLALCFAPLFETLHYGQINVIAAFGIFLLFFASQKHPAISGLGLSLAIITKFSPIIFVGYLGMTRQYKVIAWTLFFVALFSVVALARYGPLLFQDYPRAVSELMDYFPIHKNVQSFVSKLGTLRSTELLSWKVNLNFNEMLKPLESFVVSFPQKVQNVLVIYFGSILVVSGFLASHQKKDVHFFLVTSLCVLFYPNLIWYHHYVFLILPVLIWIASTKLNTRIVIWCVTWLFVVQIDRWHLTNGFLIHVFGHISIWLILYSQIKLVIEMRTSRSA